MGYLRTREQLAVARAAAALGLEKIVYTNPERLSGEEIDAFVGVPGVFFEITSYRIHPQGLGKGRPAGPAIERSVSFLRRVGVERAVVSSDGGMADAPPPAAILEWALTQYLEAGLSSEELHRLTHVNPRRLVGVPPG